MSRFRRSVPALAEITGAPLLARMRDEGAALPMATAIHVQLLPMAPEGQRKKVRRLLRQLTRSSRYIEACAAAGATRFNADGTDAGPVLACHRVNSIAELDRRAAARAARIATASTARQQQEGAAA